MDKQQESARTNIELCLRSLDTAKEFLECSKILLERGHSNGVKDRAFYSMFHVINAINALDNLEFKNHRGLISNFGHRYLKTDIFPKEWGRHIQTMELERQDREAGKICTVSKQETIDQVDLAQQMIDTISSY